MSGASNLHDPEVEQIIRSADKALKYAQGDPETALLHARKAVDAICRGIYENESKTSPKGLPLGKMIEALSKEMPVLPKKVMYSLRVIQNFGGANAHENLDECLEPALGFFSIIIDWYFQDYRKTGIPNQIKVRKKTTETAFFSSAVDAAPVTPASGIEVKQEMFRVHSLFGYEIDGGRDSELWHNPFKFHVLLSERRNEFHRQFQSWLQTKRQFSVGEITYGRWVKIGDHGHQFHIRFHTDGSIDERIFFNFDENDYWKGSWKLNEGILRMNFGPYEMDIVASRDGIHAGVEDEGDQRNAYYRLIHIR